MTKRKSHLARATDYVLAHLPEIAIVGIFTTLLFAALSINRVRPWVRDCAKHRPLVDCEVDAQELFNE